MAEESAGEKSFAPTPQRRREAARKGDVLRSKEWATAAALGAGALALAALGPWLADGLGDVARAALVFDRAGLDAFTPGAALGGAALGVLPPVMALGLTVAGFTLASQLLLGGAEGRFVAGNAAFKPSRINPINGLKRIFGWHGLIELAKGLIKLALLGGIAGWWARGHLPGLMALGAAPITAQVQGALEATQGLIGALLIGLLAIAAIDWPLQRFQRDKRLMMSREELREELKQAEGSPEMKAARRQRQRDLARGGVARAMAEAQFLVTNPEHFAVALLYDPARAPAPLVLAKGRGEVALAMREIAQEKGLPVLEYPTLARALYFTTRPGQMVREELYVALAALVAFVMALKRGQAPARPRIAVPEALRFDADGRPARDA